MEANPYTLTFGKEPAQMIPRPVQSAEITDAFCREVPSQQVYIITGVRGSGKTVLMTEISNKIREKKDWIVTELNPERNLLETLAKKLCADSALNKIFRNAKINLSLFHIGLEMENDSRITDVETTLTDMFNSLKKHGKRILIAIDEATPSQNMKEFVSAFQIFVRQDLPVFLLMTGLYDNINNLQNEKTLTFLYRAPKIELEPLNLSAIANNYRNTFHIDIQAARDMAQLTKGYSFAFQVLGYFSWEAGGDVPSVMDIYRQYLEEYVYEKIWAELSAYDKKVLYAIAKTRSGKISDIRDFLNAAPNQFSPYRRRLMKKGIIRSEQYGYLRFALPLFDQFTIERYEELLGE